jgi:hypothetical protein
MAAAPPDRRAIVTEALHTIDDLTARLEIAEKCVGCILRQCGFGFGW